MDWPTLRDLCLSHLGSEETYPFGPQTAAFKVSGKIFALSRPSGDPLTVSLKCDPLLAEQLRAAHPQIVPGYHLNKRHWNTVTVGGGMADAMIADMIEDSYDLIVASLPESRRRALLWPGERG